MKGQKEGRVRVGGGRVGAWEGGVGRGAGSNPRFSKVTHLHFAKIKVFIQGLGLGLRESITVNLLGDALLVTDSTCCEGCNGLVTIQVSAPNLHKHLCTSEPTQGCKVTWFGQGVTG